MTTDDYVTGEGQMRGDEDEVQQWRAEAIEALRATATEHITDRADQSRAALDDAIRHAIDLRLTSVPPDIVDLLGQAVGGEQDCVLCGAHPAHPRREWDPNLGIITLCERHRDRELDWV